jgi:hypothetical protein
MVKGSSKEIKEDDRYPDDWLEQDLDGLIRVHSSSLKYNTREWEWDGELSCNALPKKIMNYYYYYYVFISWDAQARKQNKQDNTINIPENAVHIMLIRGKSGYT